MSQNEVGPILNGLPTNLPDIDPAETAEWLESLDGVIDAVSDLNDINSADIEQISVLKDASSTAIYGSRGANGVIVDRESVV